MLWIVFEERPRIDSSEKQSILMLGAQHALWYFCSHRLQLYYRTHLAFIALSPKLFSYEDSAKTTRRR